MPPRLILLETLLAVCLVASSTLADEPQVAAAPLSAPSAAAPPSSDATLLVELDDPSAKLFLDGLPLAPIGARGSLRVAPGRHVLEARKDGLPSQRTAIAARAGETSGVVLRMTPWNGAAIGYDAPANAPDHFEAKDPNRVPLLLTGAALAVVGLGLGVGLNLAANGKANEVHAEQWTIAQAGGTTSTCSAPSAALAPTCGALHASLAGRDLEANVAVGSYIAGGALAAAIVAYWVWPAIEASLKPEEHHRWSPVARLAPSIDPRGAGLTIAGDF